MIKINGYQYRITEVYNKNKYSLDTVYSNTVLERKSLLWGWLLGWKPIFHSIDAEKPVEFLKEIIEGKRDKDGCKVFKCRQTLEDN